MNLRNDAKHLKIAAAQNTRERDFWLKQLEGEPVKTGFPYRDKASGVAITEAGTGSLAFTFPEKLTGLLIELSEGDEYTLNLVLISGIVLLLYKYTGIDDIIIGMPIYKQDTEGDFINTAVALRNRIEKGMTFKEFLLQVRQTINDAVDNQNYPIEVLVEKLNLDTADNDNGFPLFDTAVVLENIQDKSYLRQIDCNTVFSFRKENKHIHGTLDYNPLLYEKYTIENIISHLANLLETAFSNAGTRLLHIEILTEKEKNRLLYDFNNTAVAFPGEKTILQQFEEQVEKNPGSIAVSSPLELNDIYDELESRPVNPNPDQTMGTLCLRKNSYLYQLPLPLTKENESARLTILKTHRHNSVVVSLHVMQLLDLFDGRKNLHTLYSRLKDLINREETTVEFLIYSMRRSDLLEITVEFDPTPEIFMGERIAGSFALFIQLVKSLYRLHLLEWVGVETQNFREEPSVANYFTGDEALKLKDTIFPETLWIKDKEPANARVLLLGDTPGTATTGLLYLGSYLRREGIKVYCQFYDPAGSSESMKKNLEALLAAIQPTVVGISMKWFLYIARVVDMGKMVKAYARENSLDIKVVVGGNTASYYWEEVIAFDWIDILVRGDGELPLLKICRGEEEADIPNIVYKKNGTVMENPITYIHHEGNSPEIYLSHLEEILLSNHASCFGTFFIVTHKGCAMNCLYCGGCNRVQRQAFNRENVFKRGVEEVRKDILEARPYTSTFQFEFDILDKHLADYCQRIWEGIDLSRHFCIFSRLTPPGPALIRLVSQTFKYVYWDFDVCTLSQRHREQLFSLGLVKPQPADEEILDFLAACDHYQNIEVRLNLITGLPYFRLEDIEPGERLLDKIMKTYSCFGELHWARLHAQPGAPIVENAAKHHMHSLASTFEDFLAYSQENFNPTSGYLNVEDFNYPYIYFNDDRLNSRVTNFYLETNKKVDRYRIDRQRRLLVCDTLTYGELDDKARQLGGVLGMKGVGSGRVVGLMLERSPEIPAGILGIFKAGCAYMPIDPEFPTGRIEYMLKDSNAAVLVTTGSLSKKVEKLKGWDGDTIFLDAENRQTGSQSPRLSSLGSHHSDVAYVIYTSGTTGKPKGVLLKHENLANYVYWFTTAAAVTEKDKTALTSSFAFDLGYTSLYTSLLKGGELHILPREIYLVGERFLDYIRQKQISYIKVTPSLFSVIVDSPNFSIETCKGLRLAAIGGEAIHVEDIEKAHACCPHLRIMNHYGPTEATIGCIAALVDFHRFDAFKEYPVIGTPIYNTVVSILGKDLNMLPEGVPGELCISGTCLGRGYLNRPELTAEKFLKKEQPMYKTGDLARWLPDGNIQFLGRIDNQVKVRGYRIELSEIENRLRLHSMLDDALVVVKEPEKNAEGEEVNEDKYLCAYIIPKGGKILSAGDSRDAAAAEAEEIYQSLPIVTRFRDQVRENPGKTAVKAGDQSLTYDSLNKKAVRLAHEISLKYDDRYKLSGSERTRYHRQILLHGWRIESQEKLKSTTVFVAGAGGGASPTIMQLALAGFGTIIVCDFDDVELSNLNRQFLHNDSRIGMNKALSAQMTIKEVNPNVTVVPVTEKLTRENVAELVGDAAFIFDMLDGLESKFILSQYAVSRGIPHVISAMADINAYSVLFHPPHTPCYHCIFDRKKWEEIAAGMGRVKGRYQKEQLPVVATSLFMSTAFAVNEAIKIILGLGKPAYNKFIFFNQRGDEELAWSQSFRAMIFPFSEHFKNTCKAQGFDWDVGWRGNFLEELTIEPNPDCPVCGKNKEETANSVPMTAKPGNKENQTKGKQRVASLLSHGMNTAIGIAGTLQAGKTLVPLDPDSSPDTWGHILEDSESRIILTDNRHREAAEKLRDEVNKNIKILEIDNIEEHTDMPDTIEPDIPPEQTACLLYPRDGNASIKAFYEGLRKGTGPVIFEPKEKRIKPESLSSDLRTYLLEELPEYMIPSRFVPLEQFPLTPNGKIDRKALPQPGMDESESVIAPGNEIEEKLAGIWSEVLGKEKETISMDTNFFQLGGHSLNATIMAAKIYKELNVNVPLAEVFTTPTIRGLAEYVKHSERNTYIPIQPLEEKEYYPLSSAQKRVYVFQQLDPESTSYNMPLLLELGPEADKERLTATFKKLIKRHESLRTSFKTVTGEPVQKIHHDVEFEIEYYEWGKAAEAAGSSEDETSRVLVEVQVNMQEESRKPELGKIMNRFFRYFDLSRAPLLRVGLLCIPSPGENPGAHYILMIDMNHIIADGISLEVLKEEFYQVYAGKELPPLKLQYKDYSQWQNGQRENSAIIQQESYWLKEFEGEIAALDFPTDYRRPEIQSFDGDFVGFELGAEETEGLKRIAREKDMTMFMILLAVFNIFLAKICRQEDIIIGTPIAGRRHTDLEQVIGMFVNVLAMRNRPNGTKTFEEFLGEVKENTLKAFENQDYQYDELVRKLGSSRYRDRTTLVETHFVMQNIDTGGGGVQTGPGSRNDTTGEGILETYKMTKTRLEMALFATEQEDTIEFQLNYMTRLFKKDTIEKFCRYFLNILETAARTPTIKIDEIELLAAEEKKRVIAQSQQNKEIFSRFNEETFNEIF